MQARQQVSSHSVCDSTQRVGSRFHLDTVSRFGFDAEAAWYQADVHSAPPSSFGVGDLNATYRFAQSHHAQWWAGAGFSWLTKPEQEIGWNLTYGGDFFIGDPWILSGSIDYGQLGDRELFHGRATI